MYRFFFPGKSVHLEIVKRNNLNAIKNRVMFLNNKILLVSLVK